MTTEQFSELNKIMQETDDETAVFLLAGSYKNEHGTHLTVRRIVVPSQEDYDDRSGYHIQVSPLFFNRVIGLAEANNVTVIQCHSHPHATEYLEYSPTDYLGEKASAKTIHDCLLGSPMGSLLFGKTKIKGRIWLNPNKEPEQIDEIRLVGRHYRKKILSLTDKKIQINEKVYDRQIKAFGLKGQKTLSQQKIGIVGLGGTGSSVSEQLAREGIEKFCLVDHDFLEDSNKTRVYGSNYGDYSEHKTDVAKRNILKINPHAKIITNKRKIESTNDLSQLKDCDVVFSCVDRHAPRSLLNNFSYQYHMPVIDIGVGLDTENNMVVDGHMRATLIGPSLPCLFCMGIVDPDIILAESTPEQERKKLEKEGYIRGLQDDVPAVIPYTTMAASMGVMLLKDLLFSIIKTEATTLSIDVTTFQSSRLVALRNPDCVCQEMLGKDDKPHLEEVIF